MDAVYYCRMAVEMEVKKRCCKLLESEKVSNGSSVMLSEVGSILDGVETVIRAGI